jgi:hypothetical protein
VNALASQSSNCGRHRGLNYQTSNATSRKGGARNPSVCCAGAGRERDGIVLYSDDFPVFSLQSRFVSAEASHSKQLNTNPKQCSPNIAPNTYCTTLHLEPPTPSRGVKIAHPHTPGHATGPPAKSWTHGTHNGVSQEQASCFRRRTDTRCATTRGARIRRVCVRFRVGRGERRCRMF